MTTPRMAAIYARISSDQDGRGLGVARQVEDCRKLASDRGWAVAEEYVDNDVSAYSGRPDRRIDGCGLIWLRVSGTR
jgi:site-specific DNA recombinase